MEFIVPIKHKYGLEGLYLIEADFGSILLASAFNRVATSTITLVRWLLLCKI